MHVRFSELVPPEESSADVEEREREKGDRCAVVVGVMGGGKFAHSDQTEASGRSC